VVDLIGEGGTYIGQRFDEDDMHLVCPWHGYEFICRTDATWSTGASA